MANWNLPTPASGYLAFVDEINTKFVDAATLQIGSPINLPENTIRYNRSINLFQEWIAGNWVNKVLSVAGGGTGSTTPGGVVTNLGLGNMALQNSNAVAITGGSITGVAFDVSALTGVVPLARGGTGSSLALGSHGSVLGSHSGIVQFFQGTGIAELNASALSVGTVPDARQSANIAMLNKNQTFTGNNIITNFGPGPDNFAIRSVYPLVNFNATADTGTKTMRVIYSGANLQFQAMNDADTAGTTVLQINYYGPIHGIGTYLTNLNASNIAFGIVAPQFLGTGTANAGTFLRGDGTWQAVTTGGGGSDPIPSGLIGIFDTNCPAGWTRYTQLDNRFPLGSSGAGGVGGSNDHSHSFDVTSGGGGNHDHSFGGSFGGSGSGSGNFGGTTGGPSQTSGVDAGGSFGAAQDAHTHGYNVAVNLNVNVTTNIDGRTGAGGDHTHRVAGGTGGANHVPPYYTVVFCRKN